MKLSPRFKTLLYSVCAGTYAGGAIWWAYDRFIRVEGVLGPEHHPAQHWWIRIHAVFAYALLIALGYLIKIHIEPGLRGSRRKKSGLTLLSSLALLILSAFPVLYAMEGPFRSGSAWIHTYLGLGCPLLLVIHLQSKIRARQRPVQHS